MATADSPISDSAPTTVARPEPPMSAAHVTSATVMGKTGPLTSLSLVHNAPPTLTDATTSSALSGSTDSAQRFLRDVHNEAESEKGSGSRRGMFWRSRSSVSSKDTKLVASRGTANSLQGSGNGPQGSGNSKEMRTGSLGGSRGSVSGSRGLMGGPRGSVSGSRGSVSGSVNSKHYARMGLVMESLPKQTTSPRASSVSSDVSESVVYDGGYEVVELEGDVLASPPISMQSEALGSGGEGPASSPDSGYGNTPDNPDHLAKVRTSSLGYRRGRSGAISGCERREGTQDSALCMESSTMEPHPHLSLTGVGYGATPTSANAGLSQVVTQSLSSSGDSRPESREVNDHLFTHSMRPAPQTIDSHHTYLKKRRGQSTNRGQGSRPFSKSTELRSSKSFSAQSPPQDEKDYFQVTDELSQENAHLSMSEALLAVIEHYKATCLEQSLLQDQVPSSPQLNSSLPGNSSLFSRSPSTPGESAFLSSWGSMSSVATLDDPIDGRGSHSTTRVSLLQLMQSQSCDHSAESTAQNLIQHMASHMTGNMRDISKLSIKLPTEFLISLQNDEDLQRSVTTSSAHMRGNKEWAPPRKQFIYHIKEANKNVQVELAAQGHRCTGCGMKVNSAHSKHFRFCNYVGKYFCQNCHTNATHIIPAQILERWSFKRLPVSNFARDLLTKFFNDAVFSVHPEHKVYSRVFVMSKAKEVRTQLVEIKQYLRTCRRASKLHEMFNSMSPWTTDTTSFSMSDFQELRLGTKLKQLETMLAEAMNHVKTCLVCQGKGFVCEFCKNNEDIIFPFEATKVSKCACCNNCFHKHCFSGSAQCPRCERIKERQKQRVSKIVLEAEEEDDCTEESCVDSPG